MLSIVILFGSGIIPSFVCRVRIHAPGVVPGVRSSAPRLCRAWSHKTNTLPAAKSLLIFSVGILPGNI